MRDNAIRIFALVCLALARLSASAQIQIGPHGFIVIDQSRLNAPGQGHAPTAAPATGDLLQFLDGSSIHGDLQRMDSESGLRWGTPLARQPIDLQPSHLDSIRFAHAGSVSFSPTSRLRFANGDDLLGSVTSMNDNNLAFSTWFGDSLTIPRAYVQSITYLSSNYNILYEGPDSAEDWIVGNRNPDSWTYRDGTFTSGSTGTLGRDFKLSGSSTIEFDLAWSDKFELLANIYCDAQNYGNSYVLDITSDQVNLRCVEATQLMPLRTFGSAPLNLTGKNKAHITIQANKDEATVAIFVDNVLVKRWKDENGFSGMGGGILFVQEDLTGAVIKLSNITISQWSGRFEPETYSVATNTDVIRFINHDQAGGKIERIGDGKVTLTIGESHLQIPIQRVTQINFMESPTAAIARDPWEVRAQFPRGGSLSFQLEKWSDKEVSGRSPIFGRLAFQPGQIRRLEFNLGHPKTAAPVESVRDFEGLDE